MRYCLMLKDGQCIENNFALIVINAGRAGNLENLVVLKPHTRFHDDLGIEPSTVVITDVNKKFLSRVVTMVKVTDDMIQESYLDYLTRHNMDGTPIISCSYVENEIEENKYYNSKKVDWHKHNSDKRDITELSNVYFDIFDIISNKQNEPVELISYLADNGVHTFQKAVIAIKEYLNIFGYRLLFRNDEFLEWDMHCGIEIYHRDNLSDSIGKFWIIKDEERHFNTRTRKPLTIYAEKTDLGYIIGNQGKNVKKMCNTFNSASKYWEIPYIKVLPIEERVTNNDIKVLNDKCYDLLNKIFKELSNGNV